MSIKTAWVFGERQADKPLNKKQIKDLAQVFMSFDVDGEY
jgi:hypothetical protein